jgi:hypothetical protein
MVTFLKILLQLLGISQEIANLTPDRRFQELSLDLAISANAFPSEAIAVRAGASIVPIVLQAMLRPPLTSRLAVIGVTANCTAGESL